MQVNAVPRCIPTAHTHTHTHAYMYIHIHTRVLAPPHAIVHAGRSKIPYSRKYWRELYLADWRILVTLPILNPPIIILLRQPRRLRRGDRTETAKFISANCNFLSNPPNIIPANIFGYTVPKNFWGGYPNPLLPPLHLPHLLPASFFGLARTLHTRHMNYSQDAQNVLKALLFSMGQNGTAVPAYLVTAP